MKAQILALRRQTERIPLLPRLRGAAALPRCPLLPDGDRLYAVGDVHGRFDLLYALLHKIEQDNASRGPSNTLILLLGSLVDKGPHAREVVEFARTWKSSWARLDALMGDPEAMFLSILAGRTSRLNGWLDAGGAATLRSYLLSDDELRTLPCDKLVDLLARRIPFSHREWLRQRPAFHRCGDYLFLPSGTQPGASSGRRPERDPRVIRADFRRRRREHGLTVVHSHSGQVRIADINGRVGLETPLEDGCLGAIGLEGGDRWSISARAKG